MSDMCPKCGEERFDSPGSFRCGSYWTTIDASHGIQSYRCRANYAEQAAKWLITALAGCAASTGEDEWDKQDIANVYAYASKKWPEFAP